MSGGGEGDECPTSALKPKAVLRPSPEADAEAGADGTGADGEVEEFSELPVEGEAVADDETDAHANATRTQPSRNRAKPERLDSSPKGRKASKLVDKTEVTVKPEKGQGRGQKPGPRGAGGMPMKYQKRDTSTAGNAAGKRAKKPKVEEGRVPNPRLPCFVSVSFIWIAF